MYQSFDPFGNLLSRTGAASSSFGFAGEWTDATGLQYLRARYYSMAQGRFMSRDPFQGYLTQPASMNPYTYGLNNPVRYVDPTGNDWWDTVGEFNSGLVYEFGLTLAWGNPQAKAILGVSGCESSARLAGRITGDIFAIILGTGLIGGGITSFSAGLTICGTGVLCPAGVAISIEGVLAAGLGAGMIGVGAVGLGNNLAYFSKNSSETGNIDSFDMNSWKAKRPFEGTIKNPDGTTTEFIVRKTPGRDGGWSRIVIVRDQSGKVINVSHEAWKGISDPRVDPPYHVDDKR